MLLLFFVVDVYVVELAGGGCIAVAVVLSVFGVVAVVDGFLVGDSIFFL